MMNSVFAYWFRYCPEKFRYCPLIKILHWEVPIVLIDFDITMKNLRVLFVDSGIALRYSDIVRYQDFPYLFR